MTEPPDLSPVRRTSPLDAFHERLHAASTPECGAVVFRELPFLAHINLRGDPDSREFLAAVRAALDLDLPTKPNTVTVTRAMHALWLGPDEWLLVDDPETEEVTLSRLRSALAGLHAAATNVGASRAVFALSGRGSRTLLMKGCGLDLHPRSFAPGQCAQTNFARTNIILEQVSDVPAWRLFVRASCAIYLARWLIDAATG